MTENQLLNAFVTAGFDTPEKVIELLQMASAQMTRNATLIAIDRLQAEQSEALAAINAKRNALQAKVAAIEDQISEAVAPEAVTPSE